MAKTEYTHRFVARVILEAATPMALHSGEKNIETDALLATDVNGLPYLPGSSIAGVLRHSLPMEMTQTLFGDKDTNGSEIIFTDGKMVGAEGLPIDGLNPKLSDSFYEHFKALPIRQHVRIGHHGTGVDKGKYDEQIVYKGSRFAFEVELVSKGANQSQWERVLSEMCSPSFRLGSGTRKGFGEMKVFSIVTREYNLGIEEDRRAYLDKSSRLDQPFSGKSFQYKKNSESYVHYRLTLHPENFILFSSGLSDDGADMIPVKENIIVWENSLPKFEEQYLLPATSLKGALAHRVAYHYNKKEHVYADCIDSQFDQMGPNKAVVTLFGYADDSRQENSNTRRGKVIFSDFMFKKESVKDKVIPHVAIDRFTGGALSGALFQERVLFGPNLTIEENLFVQKSALEDENIKYALEQSLDDLCNGLLPLGGGVNRGNGTFVGKKEIIHSNND